MLSICIISAFYPPHLGGVEVYTQNLGKSLAKKNNDVTIVTSQTQNEPLCENDGEVEIVRIRSKGLLNDRFPIPLPTIQVKKQIEYLKSKKFDLVVINTRYYPICLIGLQIAKKSETTPLVVDHSSDYLRLSNPLFSVFAKQYEKKMTSLFLRNNAHFYAVSEKSSQWLQEFGITTYGLLPNAIDPALFRNSASKTNWSKSLKLSKNAFIVVYIGRLIKEKGIMETIHAIKSLNAFHYDIHLCIAGNGPLQSTIEKTQNSNIHYLGKLNSSDVSSLLRDSDVLCFPSNYPEGLPTIVLEAGAHKLGVIMSQTGGTTDLIPSEEFGIVLNDTEIDSIANAILCFYNNRNYMKSCGENLSQRINTFFTWDSTAKKLLATIEQQAL